MNRAASLEQKYRELQAQHALSLEHAAREAQRLNTQLKHQQDHVKKQQLQLAQHQKLIENQQTQIQQQQSEIATYQSEIAYLQERLNILLSKRYQAQSEQLKYIQGQLFDEAELEQEIAETRQALDELKRRSDQQPGSSTD